MIHTVMRRAIEPMLACIEDLSVHEFDIVFR